MKFWQRAECKIPQNLLGHIDHTAVLFCHFNNPFTFTSPTTVFNLGQLEAANWQAALMSIQQARFSATALAC